MTSFLYWSEKFIFVHK